MIPERGFPSGLQANSSNDPNDREAYATILQISMTENEETYTRMKEVEKGMSEAFERIMEDRIVAREDARSEDIATRMIKKNKPIDEIREFTDVSESHIRELAAAAGLTVVS